MEYKSFGRSGVKTSRLCFGAMLLSSNGRGAWRMPAVADEATCAAMLDRYVAAGGNFIDTSDNYGESELIIGNWLKKQSKHTRRKLLICTKFTSPINTIPAYAAINYPNSSGSSRKHIMDAIEDSLEKLQTNYIDVYVVHYWDDETQLEEVIKTLQILIQMGRIRYYAVSNYTPVQMQKLISLCERQQWDLPLFTQAQYNLLCRTSEWELISLCQSYNIGFLAWSPLAGGWLSNKYSNLNKTELSKPPSNSRMSFAESVHFSSWDLSTMASNPKTWFLLRVCNEIAAELKCTVSQVAVRWIIEQDISGCIVGPRTLAHLEDNIAAVKLKLTPKHLTMLNDASYTPPIYPYCAFSELTVKSSPVPSMMDTSRLLPPGASLDNYPGLQQLIDFTGRFQTTPNRAAWMARLIDQNIYDMAANSSGFYQMLPTLNSNLTGSSSVPTNTKLALVFGGFLSHDEPIRAFRQILLHVGFTGTIQSFVYDALELLDQVMLDAKKDLNLTWIDNELNLFEWIRLGLPSSESYERPSFAVSMSLSIMNHFILLIHLMEYLNITLGQLKEHCIFASGFSLGTITAYVVDISTNDKQFRRNALAGIRLAFWLGIRTTQDFQKWKIQQYQRDYYKETTKSCCINKPDDPILSNYRTGSVQISKVPYNDVYNAINTFNSTNSVGCQFDVGVVTQVDRITIIGFVHHLPQLVEYLQSKFPSCSLVPVALDIPIHCERYFPNTLVSIINDFSHTQPQFDITGQNKDNQSIFFCDWNGKSGAGITYEELLNSIINKPCRWDLVSDRLADLVQSNISNTNGSSNSIVILDFGSGARSKNLINNNAYLRSSLADQHISVFNINTLPHGLMEGIQAIYQNFINRTAVIRQNYFNQYDTVMNSIAVIGMACRFPDSNNADEYFYNLLNRKHSIHKIPKERWHHHKYYDPNPKNALKTKAQHMGLIEEIDMFDPQFFNINMRDANHMDPQHRLTLEVCYLALENAGYVISEGMRMGMNEQRVGVFVGCTGADGYRKNMEAHLDAYCAQCEARSMQAGRVSYFFKFCGPSIQIDTACSTSLVCLHMAVNSLLNGECDAAVVSSVLTSNDPVEYMALAAGGFFSPGPTGGCKAFSADADGYTRSDGVAAIVIKPYRAAIIDRDCVHALINSTYVNQGGQSQNLLLPSEPQIESLINTVLRKAHIPPSAIQFIEAHGTGTQGGDPLEMNAIVKSLGMDIYRSKENPLYVGSHKAFIGHCEAAAGLAGLIKTVMMMQHKTITPHIPMKQVNPNIHLQQHVIIPQEACEWKVPRPDVPRRAVVNSFGFSGANASCVLQETPPMIQDIHNELIEPAHLITISGKHADSVRAYTLRFLQYLVPFQSKLTSMADSSEDLCSTSKQREQRFLRDLAFTTTARRNHFAHRIAIVTTSVKDLIRKLTAVLASIPDQLDRLKKFIGPQYAELLTPLNQGIFCSKGLEISATPTAKSAEPLPNRIAFVFGGQGSQYFGMCRQLLDSNTVWATTFRQCSELLAALHPTLLPKNMTLIQLLRAAHAHESESTDADNKSLLKEEEFISTQVCQPLLFAIEYAFGRMLLAWGIQPNYIIGHSFGELVGACLSSVMSLEDALFLIGHRARLMEQTSKGAMLAINCGIDDFNNLCQILQLNQDERKDISVAAYNSARSIVVAGEIDTVDKVQSYIAANKLFLSKKLNVTHAFHTNFMEPILTEFHAIAEKIVYRKSEIPIFDTLHGKVRNTFNADYWTQQLSQSVRFYDAVSSLSNLAVQEKFQVFCIELSPSPILMKYVTESGQNFQIQCILRKSPNDFEPIYGLLGDVYVRQLSSICWSELHRNNHHARVLSLPNYAFNYKSCWLKLPWITDATDVDTTIHSTTNETTAINTVNVSIQDSTKKTVELPLLGKCFISENESTGSLECSFPMFDRVWRADIQNHVVASQKLFSIPLYSALTSQFALYALEYKGTKFTSPEYVNINDLMVKSSFIWEDKDSEEESCREMTISLLPSKKNIKNSKASPIFTFNVSSYSRTDKKSTEKSKPVVHASGTIYFSETILDNSDKSKASFSRIIDAFDKYSPKKSVTQSLDGQEFYRLSSEFGTCYGPHYQSVEEIVLSENALSSWSKQLMKAAQPYIDATGGTLIHPSWLDSFVQAATVQVSKIADLNRPFVAMFVEKLVCRTHVYSNNSVPHTNQNKNNSSESVSKSSIFYNENVVKVNTPSLITSETRGFDEQGNLFVLVTGGLMMSASTKFGDQNDSSVNSNSKLKTENTEDSSITSVQSSPSNQSNGDDKETVETIVVRTVSNSLEVPSDTVDKNENFANMGIDSLLSIEIRGELQKAFEDINLPPTTLFDYPNVNALTAYILSLQPPKAESNDTNSRTLEQSGVISSSIKTTDTDEKSCHENGVEQSFLNMNISQDPVTRQIIDILAEVLRIPSTKIHDQDQFSNIGISPIRGIEIRENLQTTFGIHLEASVMFDCTTVAQLRELIENEIASQNSLQDNVQDQRNDLSISNSSEKCEHEKSSKLDSQTNTSTSSNAEESLSNSSTSTSVEILAESQTKRLMSTLPTNKTVPDSGSSENRPKISTIKSIYSKIKLPQINIQPELIYEPFPMLNLCEAYTLGQFLPEMAVRSHALYIKSFSADLDVDRYEKAWNECVRRHPMLRSEVNSEYCIQILKEVPYYTIQRFHTSSESEQQKQVEQVKRWRLDIGLNMSWPMIHLFAIYGPKKTVIIFDADIVAVDFFSLLLVSEEMLCLYKNQPEKLKEPISLNYRDYIMHYRALQKTLPQAQEQKKYWMDRVSTIPGGINFPRRPDRIMTALPARNPGFDSKAYRLDVSTWNKVQASIRARGLQVPTTVCALFASVLAVFCNSNHFTLNIVFVNRLPLHPEVERLVGNLSSALMLEFDFRDTNTTFYQHARNIYQRFLADLANSSFFTASHLVPILNNRRQSTFIPVSAVSFVSLLQFDEHFESLSTEEFGFYLERNAPNSDYAVLETAAMELDHQIALTGDGSLALAFDFVQEFLPENLMEHFIKCYMDKLVALINDETWESKCMLHQYNIHDKISQPLLGLPSTISTTSLTLSKHENEDTGYQSHILFSKFVHLATDPQSAYRTALISSRLDIELSYQTVLFLSLKLASQLKKFIHEKKDQNISTNHIGVTCQRGWEQVISCLAISMIGGVFVPIDGDLPFEQYKMRLKISNIAAICTTKVMVGQLRSKFQNNLNEFVPLVEVDSLLADDFRNRFQNSDVQYQNYMHYIEKTIDPKMIAYVIFTSGTTGLPKPVSISHAAVMNTINDVNKRIDLSNEDRVIALANVSFDLSIWDIFGSFSIGSTLVLLDDPVKSASDPFYWLHVIEKYQITVWNSVPQLLYLLYHSIDQNDTKQTRAIRSLRQILLSGDWIPMELPFKLYSLWETAHENKSKQQCLKILSLGGATECSIWSNFHWIDCTSINALNDIYADWLSIPYGQPLSGQSLYILSSTLDFCPDYVVGQLYIGGAGLATEYYQDTKLTDQHFIIHPMTNERLYATGDSARYRWLGSDRVVEIVGRIDGDSQVKVQGYRIECTAIEWTLNQLDFVKQAVVIVSKSTSLSKRTNSDIGSSSSLIGCIVLNNMELLSDQQQKIEASIMKHCQNSLPHYMIPHNLLFIKEIPRSFNGKVDREALRAIYMQKSSLVSDCKDINITSNNVNDMNGYHTNDTSRLDALSKIPPSSSMITALWNIWTRALNRTDHAIPSSAEINNMNIFALGANSLTLLVMRSMILKEFGCTLPLTFFMEEPQLYHMAKKLKKWIEKNDKNGQDDTDFSNSLDSLVNNRKAHIVCLNRVEKPISGPLIFFHPSTGGIHCYRQISQLLIERTSSRNSYAIQAFGLEDNEAAESDLDQIVQAYYNTIASIEQISSLASSSHTFTFIGYSFGGILAYKVAQEFFQQNQGHLIESIFLLDTPGPLTPHYNSPVTEEKVSNIVLNSLNAATVNSSSTADTSLEIEALSQVRTVTRANLVSIRNDVSKMNNLPLTRDMLERLIEKMIFIRASEGDMVNHDEDSSWGWNAYFHHISQLPLKTDNQNTGRQSHTEDIRKQSALPIVKMPIWSSGTHFEFLSNDNVSGLVEKLCEIILHK